MRRSSHMKMMSQKCSKLKKHSQLQFTRIEKNRCVGYIAQRRIHFRGDQRLTHILDDVFSNFYSDENGCRLRID